MSDLADTPVPTPAGPARRTLLGRMLGPLTLALVLIEGLTGLVLSLYYQPTPERAFASVFYISTYVGYGWLIRSLHLWAAWLLVAFAAAHAVQAIVAGVKRHVRRSSWLLGILLLLATVALAVTGVALRGDLTAQWTASSVLRLFAWTPRASELLATALTGSSMGSASALIRTYAAHLVLLPVALAGLLVGHLWAARRQAAVEDDHAVVPIVSVAAMVILLVTLLLLFAILAPAALGPRRYVSAAVRSTLTGPGT